MHATTQTRDTRRVDMLAGCTPIAVAMINARTTLTLSIQRHRKAQTSKSQFAAKPAFTRQQVRKAVAGVRAAEAAVEAKYGAAIPVRAAAAERMAVAS